jgi:hypothetical protein
MQHKRLFLRTQNALSDGYKANAEEKLLPYGDSQGYASVFYFTSAFLE